MSGARRVLRFLLIALVLALFAGTAVADEETFYCGETFVTMPVGNGWMSLRKDDVRMMMTGISGTDGSHVGIVVFMNPEKGETERLVVLRDVLTRVLSCLSRPSSCIN